MAEPYVESQAVETQGTRFLWHGIHVGEQVSFSGPGGTAGTFQVTNLQSIAVEKRPSLPDNGQFSFECNLVPGDEGQQLLIADRRYRRRREAILELSDGTRLTFNAFCTGFSPSGAVDSKVSAAVTLEVDGDVDWSTLESA